jgi:hypothetical protein
VNIFNCFEASRHFFLAFLSSLRLALRTPFTFPKRAILYGEPLLIYWWWYALAFSSVFRYS